jgi:hypothetical protein
MAIPLMSLPLLAGALIGLRQAPGAASGRRRDRGAVVGGIGGDAALALHGRFIAVRGGLVHDRDRAGDGGRRTLAGAKPLRYCGTSVVGAFCCMRWKRSTCCAVDGRSRSGVLAGHKAGSAPTVRRAS